METNGNNKLTGIFWLLTLILICISSFVFIVVGKGSSSSDLAFNVGYYLAYAAVAWLILYLLFFRGKKSLAMPLSFAAIYFSMMFASFVNSSQQAVQERSTAVDEMQKNVQDVFDQAVDSDGFPVEMKKLDETPTIKGERGEVERLYKSVANNMIELQNEYLQELDSIGWNDLLAPASFASDDDLLSHSKQTVTRAKKVVDKYENKSIQTLKDTVETIDKLDLNKKSREVIKKGFNQELADGVDDLRKAYSFEKKIVKEAENLVNFMVYAEWSVEGDTILFSTDQEVARYNEIVSDMDKIMTEQEKDQRMRQEKAIKAIEALK